MPPSRSGAPPARISGAPASRPSGSSPLPFPLPLGHAKDDRSGFIDLEALQAMHAQSLQAGDPSYDAVPVSPAVPSQVPSERYAPTAQPSIPPGAPALSSSLPPCPPARPDTLTTPSAAPLTAPVPPERPAEPSTFGAASGKGAGVAARAPSSKRGRLLVAGSLIAAAGVAFAVAAASRRPTANDAAAGEQAADAPALAKAPDLAPAPNPAEAVQAPKPAEVVAAQGAGSVAAQAASADPRAARPGSAEAPAAAAAQADPQLALQRSRAVPAQPRPAERVAAAEKPAAVEKAAPIERPAPVAAVDKAVDSPKSSPPPSGPAGLAGAIKNAVGPIAAAPKPDVAPTQAPQSNNSDVPDAPGKGAIQSALGGPRAVAKTCLDGQSSPAHVTVVFGSDGKVQSVNVTGAGSATDCVKKAFARANVGAFRRSTFPASLTITP